ncbi:Cytochrome P450 superfamily protein isoform 1 [Tripterygium wilfordii]|uniref:Cytochrome P450 superfamily protein isoform 1 n=1 Tax=Tripterygium wilfordii TaxID=458696 RepID=A0A7J7DPY3_TRIWF|nr:trimethyltridecatetraene synthase-like [Tripterygium wilfordii]KAF5748420.1 Cytochrome P450 superfamily protein isoform 1 [Tripterygium wilfordii]
MEVLSWAILALSLLAIHTLLSIIFTSPRQSKLPPGPKPWPIIGNFNLIGPLPHQSLHKLSLRYGALMQLKFGSYPVVVASSADMAKQILKTNDQIFASRPKTAAGKYTTYNFQNITWAPYGPYWRQGRKIYLCELFSSRRLESYEYIRVQERRDFTSRLLALSGKPVVLKEQLSRLTLSIISRIVLGKKYFSEREDGSAIVTIEEFQEMLDELFLLNGVLNIGDWIPWLDFLDLQGYVKRMKALKIKFDRFHDHVLDEHKARKAGVKDFVPKDMVDLLLQLSDDPSLDVNLNYDSVKGFTQDLIAGGTDTSAVTVEWAMSELMKQPDLIKKATEELDRVIGRARWVEEKDMPQLPYIEAIMKETMRKHPVAVLLAPHLALEDCNIGGYDIVKGTRVFINSWSMGRDPKIWDEPEEFRPERFIGKAIDVKGQSFELLPFGSGRRMCPGYSLGLKMIQSSLANMLHGFNWELADNMRPQDLNMDEVYGLATPRKFPLVAVLEPRLPIHLY